MSVPSVAASFAAALLDPEAKCPDGLSTWNGSDAVHRFAVYRNNIFVSLIDALSKTFTVTNQLVGDAFFQAMARVYIIDQPPVSPLLIRHGNDFPLFIDRFAPAKTVPYLADVARLEWLRVDAYHAADAHPLEHADLARVDAEELANVRLSPLPGASVLRSRYPVVSIWAAHQGTGTMWTVDLDVPEDALVTRPRLDVLVTHLPKGFSTAIEMLNAGSPLGEATSAAADETPSFNPADFLQLICSAGPFVQLSEA